MKKKSLTSALTLALLLAFVLFLNSGMTALAAPVKVGDFGVFDAEYYAENNPDVVAAVGSDFDALWTHYTMFGLYEGRLPFAPDTDWLAVVNAGTTTQTTTSTSTQATATDPSQSTTTTTTKPTTSSNSTTTQSTVTSNATTSTSTTSKGSYIGNINNKKLHMATCSTLPDAKNQKNFSSLDDAKAAGYTKDKQCKRCYPYGK